MCRVVSGSLFWTEKIQIYSHLSKTYKTYEIIYEYLGGRTSSWTVRWPSGLSYPVSDNTGGDAGAHEDDLKESSTEFGRDKRPFLLQNAFTANKLPRNTMSTYCSLLVRNSSLNIFLCGGNEPKPLGQHWNRYDPLVRLRLRFFKECFPFTFQ